MKIFLSGTENITEKINFPMKYNLNSFFYIKNNIDNFKKLVEQTELTLVDSGAFTFLMNTASVNWDDYVDKYCDFIRKVNSDKILGFLEMDVDTQLPLSKIEEYRDKIRKASDGKEIPVWHKERGIEYYKKTCKEYKGKVIAIVGRKDADIKDDQFDLFLKYAWDQGTRVHALAMTKKKIIDKIPFDYVDSTSWLVGAMKFGRWNKQKVARTQGKKRDELLVFLYKTAMNYQEYYENKWKYYENKYMENI